MLDKIKKLTDGATYTPTRYATDKCNDDLKDIWKFTLISVDQTVDDSIVLNLYSALARELKDVK